MSRDKPENHSNTSNTFLELIHNGSERGTPVSHCLHLLAHGDTLTMTGPDTVASPAAILHAGNTHALPLQGREDILATVAQWLEEGPATPTVQILTGRAGQGKTRLGMEIAARARNQGWHAGFLPACGPELFPAAGFKTVWHQPTLVIIDNAAAHAPQVRAWLAALLRQKPATHALRFLLLERTGLDSLWQDTIFGVDGTDTAPLAALRPAMHWPELGPVTDTRAQSALFAAAYRAAGGGSPPADASRKLGPRLNALSLEHATMFPILLGIVAAREGLLEARRLAPATLLARVASAHVASLEQQWAANPSVPESLRPALPGLAAASHICGGLGADLLHALIPATAIMPAGKAIPVDPLPALPGMGERAGTGLPGLLRDAVGLHLAASLPTPQWGSVRDALMARTPVALATGIARLCQDPDLHHPDLPVAWLRQLYATGLHDRATLSCLATLLSPQVAILRPIALEICESLVALLRGAHPSAPLAWALAALFRRHAALFHHKAAQECAQQVVAIHTTLAAADPQAFNPALAASLDAQADYDNTLQQHATALPSARQAMTLYTRLAAHDAAYLPLRARSLRIVATSQQGVEQYAPAEQTIRRAIDIQTRLPGPDHDADLADSYLVLSACQNGQQQHEDAMESALQAVTLYTPQARTCPDTGQPGLARALHQLAATQAELGRPQDALKSQEESFSLYTLLAERGAGDYRPDIGASLEWLSLRHSAAARFEDSLRAIKGAVASYRPLAAENPTAFAPVLAGLLLRLGQRYISLNPPQPDESARAAREALDILAPLASDDPGQLSPQIPTRLLQLSRSLEANGDHTEVMDTQQMAITLLRAQAYREPHKFHEDMLYEMERLTELAKASGRMEGMLALWLEILAQHREIEAREADTQELHPFLALILRETCLCALEQEDYATARALYTECFGMLGELTTFDPEALEEFVISTLHDMSGLLARPDQQAERLALYRQGLNGLEILAASMPQAFTLPLFAHLERLGLFLVECGQAHEALQVAQQAMERLRAGEAAGAYAQCRQPAAALLAQMMNVQAHAHAALGHDAAWLHSLTEMVSIYSALVEEGRIFYRWFLARSLTGLAACQMHMGARDRALRSCQKSVSLFRTFLTDAQGGDLFREMDDISGCRPDFVHALLEQARVQEAFSCHAAALESILNATAMLEELCKKDPAAWRDVLTDALAMLVALPPIPTARSDGTLKGRTHVVAIYRELVKQHPHLFMPELAQALTALCTGQLQASSPAWSSALDTGREAVALYTTLQEAEPDLYRAALADALYRLSVCHRGLERIDPAMDNLKAALAQYRHLDARRPEEFRMPLARCLLDMTTYDMIFKQYETALQSAHEAAALYTDLAQSDRETYQPLLKKIRDQQALIRKKLQR